MKPKTIIVDGQQYVCADSVKAEPTQKQIVVLQRGWVVVGDISKSETEVKIKNAFVIRVWGTSRGLGEIAENGPTSKTVLDSCPMLSVHPLSIVFCMNVNESKWS